MSKDETVELAQDLQRAAAILREHEVREWPKLINEALSVLHQDRERGARAVLKLFEGTMGGFTDIWICPENDHKIVAREIQTVNRRFDEIRSRIYDRAVKVAGFDNG